MRLKDRIGSYHKYMDNALVNNPDPSSSHFLPGMMQLFADHLSNRERQIQ